MKAVIAFFATAPMEVAEIAFDMCRDALKARRVMAEKIRAGQKKNAAGAATVTIPDGVVKARKRRGKAKAKVAAPAQAVAPKRRRGPRKPRAAAPPTESLPPEAELPLDDDQISGAGVDQPL